MAGVPGRGRGGGCSSFLNLAFGGLSAAQANGTWLLRVTDTAAGDTGTVFAVGSALTFTMEDPPLFGDHITDFAVYKAASPLDVDTTGKLQVRLSSTGETKTLLVPFGNDLPVSTMRDYNGDGRADYFRRNRFGVHSVYSGVNGASLGTFDFGQSEDSFFAAQVLGTAASDITVFRNQVNPATNIMQTVFQTRDSASGVITAEFYFPGQAVGIDVVPGDYDGDALVDYAIWRPSGLAGNSRFVVRPSATPNTLIEQFVGDGTEYAVGAWDTNGYPD